MKLFSSNLTNLSDRKRTTFELLDSTRPQSNRTRLPKKRHFFSHRYLDPFSRYIASKRVVSRHAETWMADESPEAAWPTSSSRKYARRVVAIVKREAREERGGKKGWLSASVGSGVGQCNEWEGRKRDERARQKARKVFKIKPVFKRPYLKNGGS